MAGDNTLQEHYAFCGMHHIFDQHKDGVTVIKFAKDDRTLLACGSRDGTLSVFNLVSEPPSLHCTLRGHEKEINGNSGIWEGFFLKGRREMQALTEC